MIIVTGGAGMIGSNIIERLNAAGVRDILLVDHMKDGRKMRNLADLDIADYMDRDDFLERISSGESLGRIEGVFHQGACSATTEWDGQYMLRNNFEYSKKLLQWCDQNRIPFIYASSASVYGMGTHGYREERACEHPINMYAYSKFLFDQYVRNRASEWQTQVVGLRYFNVYGPRESHKGSMASTAFHFHNQMLQTGTCSLFEGVEGYANGEQKRDFVFVRDVADVNLWFLGHPDKSGIYNLGTGRAQTFNDVANAVLDWHKRHRNVDGEIRYISFPEHLKGVYQHYTEADLSELRAIGYKESMVSVSEGVTVYLDWLNEQKLP